MIIILINNNNNDNIRIKSGPITFRMQSSVATNSLIILSVNDIQYIRKYNSRIRNIVPLTANP